MSLSLKLSKLDTGTMSTRKNNMPINFREYLNERLKDETFRKEYKAIEHKEARKAIAIKRTHVKHHTRKALTAKKERFFGYV